MYTKEQEAYALAEYERTGSVIETIRRLGYPSKATLYRWYERKRAGLENQHGCVRQYPIGAVYYSNTHLSIRCRICIKRNRIQPREHICLAQEVSEVWDDRAYSKEKQYTKAAVIRN